MGNVKMANSGFLKASWLHVRKMDRVINWINLYLADNAIGFP